MTIEEQDFRLTPSSNTASNFWDLELLVTIKAKTENAVSRQEFKNVGYGLTLYSAIKRICNYRIQHRHKQEAITLVQYLKEYIKLLKELKQQLLEETSKPQLMD